MKHIFDTIKLSAFVALIVAVVSCKNEEANIFGQSAAERMAESLEYYDQLLNDAPNGWLLEYYPHEDPNKMGGFPIMAKFENGEVLMSANLSLTGYGGKKEALSLYSILDSQGPVLSFGTYNEVIHYFSDPGSASNPKGNRGEIDFVIQEATPDLFVLRGIIYHNKMVMRKLAADVDWSDFQTQSAKIDSLLRNQYRFEASKQGTVATMLGLEITSDYGRKSVSFVSPEGEKIKQSFIPMPNGIQLYNPITVAGVEVEKFEWQPDREVFVSANTTESIELKSATLNYEDYIGTYVVYATSIIDPDSIYVTVEPKVEGESFTVSEELFGFPFEMKYIGNKVEIACQEIASLSSSRKVRLVGVATNMLGSTSILTSGSMYGYWREGFRDTPGIHIERTGGGNILVSDIYGFRVREYVSNSGGAYYDRGPMQEIRMYKQP